MKNTSRLVWMCAFVATILSHPSFSQDNIGDLLKDEISESKILMREYISPLMKSTSLGLNQGWYNTAKAHKFPGVDITTSISLMRIPDSETVFNVQKLGLKHFSLNQDSPGAPNAPTIFGPDETPKFEYRENPENPNGSVETFDGPPGLGLKDEIGRNVMPVPMAHIGIGLPKGTDLKIRYVPTLDIGSDVKFDMFGIGLMHDIKQYIPGLKLFPFDLSAFAGHTRLSMRYDQSGGQISGENQRAEMRMSATTIQAVISKKVSVLTVYGSAGYNIARASLAVKGTYDINDDGDTNDANEKDPLDLSFSASGPRASAGFRLKLAVFTIHADYTLQKYNALTVGFGLSVR